MNRILFPVEGVRELLEFAWQDLETRYECPRDEMPEWPELVFNAGEEIGVALFPLVDDREGMPVLYAMGCDPKKDNDWKENLERLVGGEEVFSIGLECFESGGKEEAYCIQFEEDGPRFVLLISA